MCEHVVSKTTSKLFPAYFWILIECIILKIIRRRHCDVIDLNQLFKTVLSKKVIDFVKDTGLYNSL